jgi:hypothetical protein
MKLRRFISRGLAILLILLFSQKIGAGIYLHNWFHVKSCDQSEQSIPQESINEVCHCIDDFSLPFIEPSSAEPLVISFPFRVECVFQNQFVPSSLSSFSVPRGPPVSLT